MVVVKKFNKKQYLRLIIILVILIVILYSIIGVVKKGKHKTVDNQPDSKIVFENKIDLLGKVESLDNIIKPDQKDNFNSHVKESLLAKYPRKIVDLLMETNKQYTFNADSLLIEFTKNESLKEQKRDFKINISYEAIKEFLVVEVPSNGTKVDVDNAFEYDPQKVTIVLSFDDGPNNKRTSELIDYLEDYKMSATFFMVGQKIPNQKDIVRKVANSHSEIGYHSYAHSYFTKQNYDQIKEEFNASDKELYEIAKVHYASVRPPYGSYNDQVLEAINKPFVLWNIDTLDWKYKDSEYLTDYVLTHYQDNSIILFHDSYQTSIEAAKKIIEKLYEEDVQVVSVSTLAKLRNFNLENNHIYRYIK